MPNNFIGRLGNTMMGLGGVDAGWANLRAMDEREARREDRQFEIDQQKQSSLDKAVTNTLTQVYIEAVKQGAPRDQLEKIEQRLGFGGEASAALGGATSAIQSKAKQEEMRKQLKETISTAGADNFDPNSVVLAMQKGDMSLLKPRSGTGTMQSTPGKIEADRAQIIQQYGEGSPEVQRFDQTAKTQKTGRARTPNLKNIVWADGTSSVMDINQPNVAEQIQAGGGKIGGAFTGADKARALKDLALQDINAEKMEAGQVLAEDPDNINALSKVAELEIRSMAANGEIRETARDKFLTQIKEREGAINGFGEAARRMSERLRKNPDIRTSPAKITAWLAEAANDVSALASVPAGTLNKEIPPELWNPDNSSYLRNAAALNATEKTALLTIALAYAAASGMGEGRALSNADREVALEAVGGKARDPFTIMSHVQEAYQGMLDKHRGYLRTFSPERGIDTRPLQSSSGGGDGNDGANGSVRGDAPDRQLEAEKINAELKRRTEGMRPGRSGSR